MNSLEKISKLQDRIADAQRARSRAEAARDVYQADLDTLLAELRDGFGVSTDDKALQLLEKWRGEVEQLATDIASILDEIGVA